MSSSSSSSSSSGGIGLCGLTFIVFLVLKLCGVITWSWWWVTAPLWIPAALGICLFTLFMFIALCCLLCAAVFGKS